MDSLNLTPCKLNGRAILILGISNSNKSAFLTTLFHWQMINCRESITCASAYHFKIMGTNNLIFIVILVVTSKLIGTI